MNECAKPILLVEDEPDVREALRDLLEDWGYSIVEAENGSMALALLEQQAVDPCLVILDLLMPVMDGFAFLDVVRSRPALSQLRVLITTSAPGRAPAGFELLPKPVVLESLLTAVRRHCG